MYRLGMCPRCAHNIVVDRTRYCKAIIQRFAFGDEAPEKFYSNWLIDPGPDVSVCSTCDKFEEAVDCVYFEAQTEVEALQKAKDAFGDGASDHLFVVRHSTGYAPDEPKLQVQAEGKIPDEAISRAKAMIPEGAFAVEALQDFSGPICGEMDIYWDIAWMRRFSKRDWPYLEDQYFCEKLGLPPGAIVEKEELLEDEREGCLNISKSLAKILGSEDISEEDKEEALCAFMRENGLPRTTLRGQHICQIRFLDSGFFARALGMRPRLNFTVRPKYRVSWRVKRAVYSFLVPAVVRYQGSVDASESEKAHKDLFRGIDLSRASAVVYR